jgi:hypothetical protein
MWIAKRTAENAKRAGTRRDTIADFGLRNVDCKKNCRGAENAKGAGAEDGSQVPKMSYIA